jgi:hypothetical protein
MPIQCTNASSRRRSARSTVNPILRFRLPTFILGRYTQRRATALLVPGVRSGVRVYVPAQDAECQATLACGRRFSELLLQIAANAHHVGGNDGEGVVLGLISAMYATEWPAVRNRSTIGASTLSSATRFMRPPRLRDTRHPPAGPRRQIGRPPGRLVA